MAIIRHKTKVEAVRKHLHPDYEPQRFKATSRVIRLFIDYSTEAMMHGYRIYRSGYGFRICLKPEKVTVTPRTYNKYKFSPKAFGWVFNIDADLGDFVRLYGYRFVPHKCLKTKVSEAMETDLVYKILKQ